MKEKSMDMRIWQSFFEMMVDEKYQFSQIRVKEICEVADIHRSTFYRHFEDKYQLLEFGLFVLWNDYFEIDERDKFYTPFKTSVDFYEKSEAQRLINRNYLDQSFIETVDAFFLKQMSASFGVILKEDSRNGLPNDLLTRHVASSIQMLEEWAFHQEEEITPDELDNYYKILILDTLALK
ncbi:TetR family transcriptional regulator [Vagococcus hydrophili]|uniref:TetR family transcriptional regulator n=1 Tax=Vagococcus hydrophili TaxID=2714947 RepID=A0A6G8AT97_9ENTE|nr:TetR family transcriptional regulator [Vagococcus hydrophili]QIL48200.1 TetR family transcriptional regulator [Vagococcus hydrophili]